MDRSLRRAGIAGVVTIWAGLSAGTVLAGFDLLGGRPLSYLGTLPRSEGLFAAGLAMSAILFIAFHRYVRSAYPVSSGFTAVMLVGMAGQLVAAFVPIGGDPALHRIHTTSALVLAASLPVVMWRFAAAQPPGAWRRLAYTFVWAEVAACAGGLLLSAADLAPVAEILPAAVFHAWILTLTFRPANPRPTVAPDAYHRADAPTHEGGPALGSRARPRVPSGGGRVVRAPVP
ncbi:MAG TPA: hypothetical protein VHF27_01670 [Acidimicrobiales bacterium]|nr:hypothetical protein [Acidimicrobiales bacterium]